MEHSITFVLLGKPGSGKSRTGNTIIGCAKAFEFGALSYSLPKQCKLKSTRLFEQRVCVIDTPGVSKFEKKEYQDVKALISEVGATKIIFLLCVSVGRFTDEERLLIDQYFNLFGEGFPGNTIIIFTQLDEWEADMQDLGTEKVTFDSYLQSLPEETKCILQRFHNRYLTVNNKQEERKNIQWRTRLTGMANSVQGFTLLSDDTTTGNTVMDHSDTNTSSIASKKIEEQKEHSITFVLLGKPGSGKSRTGNTIIGCAKAFEFGALSYSLPKQCKLKSTRLFEQRVCVIDTPGVSKFEKKEYQDVKALISEVGATKIIFLLCVSVGRFTDEERLLIDQYFNLFGEGFSGNTIIIFTQLDEWEADMQDLGTEKVTFDSYLQSLPEETKCILQRFHSRYLTVNNKQEERKNIQWRTRLTGMANSVQGFTLLSDDTTTGNTVMDHSDANTCSETPQKTFCRST